MNHNDVMRHALNQAYEYMQPASQTADHQYRAAGGSLDRSKERDPNGIAPNSPGAKLDAGKNRVWLCVSGFSNALQHVANVTTKGAIKYTPNGWMEVDNGVDRYMDAFGRHMLALGTGERVDADTGALHKAQMIWNLLASLELELREEKNGSNT